jgi:hypothetical protein
MHAIVLLCAMFFFTLAITPFLHLMLFLQYTPLMVLIFVFVVALQIHPPLLLLLFALLFFCGVSLCAQLFFFTLVVVPFRV